MRGVAGGMLGIFGGEGGAGGGGFGVWSPGWSWQGFHGDPAGSAVPGVQIKPSRGAQGSPLRAGMHSWQIGRREIRALPSC